MSLETLELLHQVADRHQDGSREWVQARLEYMAAVDQRAKHLTRQGMQLMEQTASLGHRYDRWATKTSIPELSRGYDGGLALHRHGQASSASCLTNLYLKAGRQDHDLALDIAADISSHLQPATHE